MAFHTSNISINSPSLFSPGEDDEKEAHHDLKDFKQESHLFLHNESNNASERSEMWRKENELLQKMEQKLEGVPPPPSITLSKLSVDEMLQKYKEHRPVAGMLPTEDELCVFKGEVESNPHVYLLNSSLDSEHIADLSMRVLERFVNSETMSSCTLWFNSAIPLTLSAKKRDRARLAGGVSPGRRLSYLARRRQVFSCANLRRMGSEGGNHVDKQRHIEIRKNSRNIAREKLKSSTRALFLSPDEGSSSTPRHNRTLPIPKRRLFTSSEKAKEKKPASKERGKLHDVTKWLTQQDFAVGGGKRRREVLGAEEPQRKRKCPRRSLTFADDDSTMSSSHCSDYSNDSSLLQNQQQLSDIHKNKLLWAVSVALKEKGVNHKDSLFKSCASTLFTLCRKNLAKILSLTTGSGTSDKMLEFARQHIVSILQSKGWSETQRDALATLTDGVNLQRKVVMEQPSAVGKENVIESELRNLKTPTKAKLIQRVSRTCVKVQSKPVLCRFKSKSLEGMFDMVAKDIKFHLDDSKLEERKEFSPIPGSDSESPTDRPRFPNLNRAKSSDSDVSKGNSEISDQDRYLKPFTGYKEVLSPILKIVELSGEIAEVELTSPFFGWSDTSKNSTGFQNFLACQFDGYVLNSDLPKSPKHEFLEKENETSVLPIEETVKNQTSVLPLEEMVQSQTSVLPLEEMVQSQTSVLPIEETVQSQTSVLPIEEMVQIQTSVLAIEEIVQCQTSVLPIEETVQSHTSVLPIEEMAQSHTSVLPIEEMVQSQTSVLAIEETVQSQTSVLAIEETVQSQTSVLPIEETVQIQPSVLPIEETVQSQTSVLAIEETVQSQTSVLAIEETVQSQTSVLPIEETVQSQTSVLAIEETVQSQTSVLPIEEMVQSHTSVLPIENIVQNPQEVVIKNFLIGSESILDPLVSESVNTSTEIDGIKNYNFPTGISNSDPFIENGITNEETPYHEDSVEENKISVENENNLTDTELNSLTSYENTRSDFEPSLTDYTLRNGVFGNVEIEQDNAVSCFDNVHYSFISDASEANIVTQDIETPSKTVVETPENRELLYLASENMSSGLVYVTCVEDEGSELAKIRIVSPIRSKILEARENNENGTEISFNEIENKNEHNTEGIPLGAKRNILDLIKMRELCLGPSQTSTPMEERKHVKRRRMVMKKGKRNWKVVNETLQEVEGEAALVLKMRLSHEWKVVQMDKTIPSRIEDEDRILYSRSSDTDDENAETLKNSSLEEATNPTLESGEAESSSNESSSEGDLKSSTENSQSQSASITETDIHDKTKETSHSVMQSEFEIFREDHDLVTSLQTKFPQSQEQLKLSLAENSPSGTVPILETETTSEPKETFPAVDNDSTQSESHSESSSSDNEQDLKLSLDDKPQSQTVAVTENTDESNEISPVVDNDLPQSEIRIERTSRTESSPSSQTFDSNYPENQIAFVAHPISANNTCDVKTVVNEKENSSESESEVRTSENNDGFVTRATEAVIKEKEIGFIKTPEIHLERGEGSSVLLKKQVLSLENYKARRNRRINFDITPEKLLTSSPMSSDCSQEKSGSGQSSSCSEKKIYNIRLKHPLKSRKRDGKTKKVGVLYYKRKEGKRHSPSSSDQDSCKEDCVEKQCETEKTRKDVIYWTNEKKNTSQTNRNLAKAKTIVEALSTISTVVEKQIKESMANPSPEHEQMVLSNVQKLALVNEMSKDFRNNLSDPANANRNGRSVELWKELMSSWFANDSSGSNRVASETCVKATHQHIDSGLVQEHQRTSAVSGTLQEPRTSFNEVDVRAASVSRVIPLDPRLPCTPTFRKVAPVEETPPNLLRKAQIWTAVTSQESRNFTSHYSQEQTPPNQLRTGRNSFGSSGTGIYYQQPITSQDTPPNKPNTGLNFTSYYSKARIDEQTPPDQLRTAQNAFGSSGIGTYYQQSITSQDTPLNRPNSNINLTSSCSKPHIEEQTPPNQLKTAQSSLAGISRGTYFQQPSIILEDTPPNRPNTSRNLTSAYCNPNAEQIPSNELALRTAQSAAGSSSMGSYYQQPITPLSVSTYNAVNINPFSLNCSSQPRALNNPVTDHSTQNYKQVSGALERPARHLSDTKSIENVMGPALYAHQVEYGSTQNYPTSVYVNCNSNFQDIQRTQTVESNYQGYNSFSHVQNQNIVLQNSYLYPIQVQSNPALSNPTTEQTYHNVLPNTYYNYQAYNPQ